ncbi:patatin-like phospholipase family protein [Roseimarinus sediminis]|uniref:patatin-like phospholipase family protein n=1 Tax=Roseimarinus sediminis TaxID=1610899 RepID=UPI003D22E6F4
MQRITLIILLIITTVTAPAQKVGLVLSGGGAKGLAHIGLIKVLEEHNIPIDYVAGTSIGAIIAGLYASGMSPEEMIELFNSDDFRLWSTGRMDKDDLYYFKRNDEHPEWLKVDITKKEDGVKLILPINIVPERQMDFAFMQLTAQTSAVCQGDFDQLFVPFRCVSTDIYHNKAVIHRHGDVGEAIRASMTFPLVYKPIEKDGVLLFDGGIVNNFPTDIMQEDFNPDFIIGHKVAAAWDKPDAEDIFSQIEAMVTQITNYEIADSVGILLETELNDVSLLDFAKVNYIYTRGIETALGSIDSIENKVQRRISKEEVDQGRKEFIMRKPELIFNNIQVEGITDNSQRRYIIESIKSKERLIDIEKLKDSYFKLTADDQIKSIQPLAFYNRQTGYFDLHMKVEPRKPLDVEFGGHLSTRSNTFGYLQANYKTFKNRAYKLSSNLYFGRFYNSFMLGGRIDSPTRRPFYISGYFTLNIWDYFATSTDLIFTDIRPSYLRQTESNFKFEAGMPYTKTGLIDVGVAQSSSFDEYYQTRVFNESDELDATTFKAYSAHIRIDKKNYDFKQYPTEGGRKLFTMRYITGTEDFNPGTTAPVPERMSQRHNYFQIEALYDQYYSLSKYTTVGIMAQAIINNNTLLSNYTSSLLNAPAFTPTPNSKSMFIEHYRANQFFAAGGKFIYKYNDNLHFRSELYTFFPIQSLLAQPLNRVSYSEEIFPKIHLMSMGAAVFHTRLGPLSIEMNYYDKPGQKWFFSVNMGFMLFNQRAF